MKYTQILAAALCIVAIACGDNSSSTEKKEETATPKALEKDGGSFEISRLKGRRNRLIEDLYEELAEKTPELKNLEKQMGTLYEIDSLKTYWAYNEKSKSYYKDADFYTNTITDSVLKQKMRLLIENSKKSYEGVTTNHKALIDSINTTDKSLKDLHSVIMIVYTLPLIEEYQKKHLPADQPIKNYKAQLEKAYTTADSIVKKK